MPKHSTTASNQEPPTQKDWQVLETSPASQAKTDYPTSSHGVGMPMDNSEDFLDPKEDKQMIQEAYQDLLKNKKQC